MPYYTYTPRDVRPFTLMVRGLSGTYDVDDLRKFIQDCKMNLEIKSIVKLDGDRWIVRLSGDSDVQAFRKLEYLLNNRVKIEGHKKNRLTQCRNCQRFGHVSSNCKMAYRCVKCGQSHGPGKCDIPGRDAQAEDRLIRDPTTGGVIIAAARTVHCINCKVDGHVASSHTCPTRIELLKK